MKNELVFEKEDLSSTQRLNEYIMTSVRTIEGIDLYHVSKNFGEHASETLLAASQVYRKNSKVELKDSRLILTKEGKLFADGIASALFFEKTETTVV